MVRFTGFRRYKDSKLLTKYQALSQTMSPSSVVIMAFINIGTLVPR